VKNAKLKPADVKAIGLSGQMHGSVFLDKQNRVIRPAILWNDQRTAAECEEIESRAGGRKSLIKMVANPALTGFTAPKILWLRNHEPKNFSRTAKVLLPKDEIRRRLTGEFASDVSDASGTLLLDVVKRQWSKPLLSKLELDIDLLPTCYESEQVTGNLTKAVAEELGLTTDCIVVAGAGDCAAGAAGNGIVNRGVLSTSIGTSGVVFVHSDEVQVDPQGRLHTFCHAVHGKWHLMGVNLSAGGSLQWFCDRVVSMGATGSASGPDANELRVVAAKNIGKASGTRAKQAKDRHGNQLESLIAEAAKVSAGSDGLFFLPYLSGERTPHADPDARGCFIGLTLAHARGHLVRAILEGVTYALRDSLEIIRELQVPVNQIRVSGGGSRSGLWRQMQADVFDQSVCTISAEEGPAYGVALLAAVGAGAFRDINEACAATVRVESKTAVNQRAAAIYDKAFPIYQRLYAALKDEFKRIAKLQDLEPG
jgi:xylulokinase